VAFAILVKLSLAAEALRLRPDSKALPGVPTAEKLVNGLAALVLVGLLGAALFGLAQWSLGSHGNNVGAAQSGKKKFGVSIGCAFAVGALAAIFNFAVQAGGTVQK
jgi:hypothetical protein